MTISETKIKLSDIIAPSFYDIHRDIKRGLHTHYALGGGRGSCKSTFASVEIVKGIMQDPDANAIVFRKVASTLSESVLAQLQWSIHALGVDHLWRTKQSPIMLIYKPTGQRIVFRGADNPRKIKSVKLPRGYIKYAWYEEVDEFTGPDEIRTINQSVLRGGSKFFVFYTYNPPKSAKSWVNVEFACSSGDTLTHNSTYLDVPREWLGDQFIAEAERLKKSKPTAYEHEYLGKITGTNAEIFPNVKLRTISDDELEMFDKVRRGLDWGYGADPFAYVALHFQRNTRTVFIYYEYYKHGAKFDSISESIKQENKLRGVIHAESAEPRSNDELRQRGHILQAVRKGADSVEHGIKWLQDLDCIVIDPNRCPNAAREFSGYELEPDGKGGFRDGFPDKDNHTIDAVRYALEDDIGRRKVGVMSKAKLGVY